MPFMHCVSVCVSLCHLLFLFLSAPSSQALNVHIICQKIKLFRYEQRVKACPTFAFWFATLCSELPFAIGTSLIAANLIYFMCELNVGLHNWLFFVGVVSCVAAVGNTVAIALAAVIRKEMIVRDLFLLFAFLMTISNGYLFHYDKSKPYIEKVIVCARHASVVETATYAHTQTHRLTHRLTHTHTHTDTNSTTVGCLYVSGSSAFSAQRNNIFVYNISECLPLSVSYCICLNAVMFVLLVTSFVFIACDVLLLDIYH